MNTVTDVHPVGIALWWQAIRPKTLGMAINPVLVGTAIAWLTAGHMIAPQVPLVILLCAIAIQAGTNLFNDLQDGVQGTDTTDRLGPPRLTALGWAKPHQVSIAALTAFLIALLGGLYLITFGGWPIFFGGLAALGAGYLYSYGPYPVSRTPLGELVVIAFFGVFAVAGTVYLMTGTVPLAAVMWGIVMGLPAGAVLLLNNVRDIHSDTLSGRKTLAILIGVPASRVAFAVLLALPFIIVGIGAAQGWEPIGGLAMLAAVPHAYRTVTRFFNTPPSVQLNPLLGATVRLQGLMAITAIVGMAILATL